MLRFPVLLAALVLGSAPALAQRQNSDAPPLDELRNLLKQHVHDIPQSELDSAASQALLDQVQGRILASGELVNEEQDAPAIALKQLYAPGCLYVRVGQVSLGLAPQLAAALRDTNFTANATGLVLDLRFAGGTDYTGAANVANLFLNDEVPLLDWGNGAVRSTAKTNAWTRPVTVLVNAETTGAAEALAASLRHANISLVIGSRTAGKAAIFREVPLADGRRLRLATARVRVGEGTPLGPEGLKPDIAVKVHPQQERVYLMDPYTNIVSHSDTPGSTNSVTTAVTVRRRISEAELVRQHRSALGTQGITNETTATNTPARIVRDPVLGRALDLLRNLAVLQPTRS